jgi:hypothetical protein
VVCCESKWRMGALARDARFAGRVVLSNDGLR